MRIGASTRRGTNVFSLGLGIVALVGGSSLFGDRGLIVRAAFPAAILDRPEVFAVYSRATGEEITRYPRIVGYPDRDGRINAITSDRTGGWYIGGDFRSVGGISCPRLAHLRADKSLDSDWCPNPNKTVRALALSGPRLYAGGDFTKIGGERRSFVAALDAGIGKITDWDPRLTGRPSQERGGTLLPYVDSLVVGLSTVYAAGFFEQAGGKPRPHLVALRVSDGKATRFTAFPRGAKWWRADVSALVLAGRRLYVGGELCRIGGTQGCLRLAAVNRATGTVLSWRPRVSHVEALAATGATVYVAGESRTQFPTGKERPFLQAFDARTAKVKWRAELRSFRGCGTRAIQAIALSVPILYAAGCVGPTCGEECSGFGLAAFATRSGRRTLWRTRPLARGFYYGPPRANAFATSSTALAVGF